MKKKLWQSLLFLFGLCFILLASTSAHAMNLNTGWGFYEMERLETRANSLIYTHSESVGGRHNWRPCELGKSLPLDSDTNCVLLSVKLPKVVHFQNPVLFFVTENQAVRVFMDGELLYSSEEFNQEKKVYGRRWHMINLPSNYLGRRLVLQLYGSDSVFLGRVNDVSIDEGFIQIQRVFKHDMGSLLSIPLGVIMIVILLMQYFYNRQAQSRDYIMIAIFLGLLVIYQIATSWTVLYVFNVPDFWHNISMLSIYLTPLSLLGIAYNNLHNGMKKAVRILMQAYLGMLLLVIGIELIGSIAIHQIMLVLYSITSCIMLLVCWMLYYQGWKEDHHHCRRYFWPIGLTVVLDMAAGIMDISYWSYREMWCSQFNMLPMFCFVIWLIRHTMQEEQRLKAENKELAQEVTIVKRKAMIDTLTRCFTRAKYQSTMEDAIEAAEEEGVPFCLLMFDLDFFKRVNDTYGHDMGDKVLVDFANIIRRHLDARHTFIRFGGEEFVLICSAYNLEAAYIFADGLRKEIAQNLWVAGHNVTCSVGVGEWNMGKADTIAAIQKRADLALYYAKENGRNRCVKEVELQIH